MRNTEIVRAGVLAVVSCLGVAWLGTGIDEARAQSFSMSTSAGFGEARGAPVTRDHLTRYAKVLGLSADQMAAAELLVEGAVERYTLAQVEMSETLGDLRAEAAESGDWRIMMEEMPPVREKHAAERARIERQFFEDLRLLLTPEQEGRWEGVERTKRRLSTIGRGSLAGESVDLVEICDTLDPPPDVEAKLAPVLDRYEVALDRALAERNTLQEEQGAMMMPPGSGGSTRLDMNAISKLTAEIRAASTKVREVNQSYARQIGGILTGDLAAGFERLWRKGSYPRVYAETYTGQVLDAATGFEDLSPEQRARLEQIQARYELELDAANEKWVRAIEESEDEGQGGVMVGAGGQMMMVEMGDTEGGPVDDARTARRDLNRQFLAQVRGLLSPDQRSRLPQRELAQPIGGGAPGGHEMMFIVEEEVDDGPGGPGADDSGRERTR